MTSPWNVGCNNCLPLMGQHDMQCPTGNYIVINKIITKTNSIH